MQQLLGFDKMVTPIIIRIVYFLGLLVVLITGVATLFSRACDPGRPRHFGFRRDHGSRL
jgi:hypothetical protein